MYIGRVCFAGITPDGYPSASYAISGRRPSSQKRRFVPYWVPTDNRIYVGPIGEPTDEQKRDAHLIFYNCMRVSGDRLFVTNGAQTDVDMRDGDVMPNFYENFGCIPGSDVEPIQANEILSRWGYEHDPPIFTPRIALVNGLGSKALFAIAARESDDDPAVYSAQAEISVRNSNAVGLATYQGDETDAIPWRGNDIRKYNLSRCILQAPIRGSTPDEIRDSLYDYMDPRYVVAAVAAVYDGRRWVISEPKNRFADVAAFEAYASEAKK